MRKVTRKRVKYTGEAGVDIAACRSCKPFKEWLALLDQEMFIVRGVHFQHVDYFKEKVGFVKFKADVYTPAGGFIPGIVFMRGGSVGILPILECDGELFTVLVVQPRVPTGQFYFEEIPAGMLDGSGNFAGVAARELEEELGLTINVEELRDLTAEAGYQRGIFTTPGGSDETIRIFSFYRKVTKADIEDMNGRVEGLPREGEYITLKIVPLESIWQLPDAKTVVAYTLHKKLCCK